jgi:hypothetical protein
MALMREVGQFQRVVSNGLFIVAFVLLIGSLLMWMVFPWDIYINYIWISILSIFTAFIGLIIKCDGLQRELSQK